LGGSEGESQGSGRLLLRRIRRGFTIIEVLVSVVLMMVVVLGIMKIFQENRSMALYLSDRSKSELSNTLFLTKEAERYDGEKKDAYTLLSATFKIEDDVSREILKRRESGIIFEDPLKIGDDTFPVEVNEILLKSDYSSRYLRFKTK